MNQIKNKKKFPILIFVVLIIILIFGFIMISFLLKNNNIDRSHKIPIINESDEQIGVLEVYEIHPDGGHKTVRRYKLDEIILYLDNNSNYAQFSGHFILNSTESDFSIEFIDNGDNRLDEDDHFIFYNYTVEPWIRIICSSTGRIISTKIYIY